MLNVFYLLLGIGLLTVGGEILIRGALSISAKIGITPLLTGLVIVGFGTSMPELVVSVNAALSGQPDIAIGNVIGSNIANILLVLGLCAAITPLVISPVSLHRDAPVVIISSFLFIFMAFDSALSMTEGLVLIALLVTYLGWAYQTERDNPVPSSEELKAEAAELNVVSEPMTWTITEVIGGLVLLILGSQILLKGAVGIAYGLGVSEAVIGLTLVAVGTSLPELTISVIAALKKQADLAVGNILGSNIFNLLGILGVSAILQPIEVKGRIVEFDQWVMLGVSILLYVFLFTARKLSRMEGAFLLFGYFVYVAVSYTFYPN